MKYAKSVFRKSSVAIILIFLGACISSGVTEVSTADTSAGKAFQRVLGLQGGENFRDFGGYSTEDGNQLKTGLLYRSNQLDRLTDEDYQIVDQLGIRLVVDFRDASERGASITRWQGNEIPHFLPLAMPSTGKLAPIQKQIEVMLEANVDVDEMNEVAVELYRVLPFEHAAKYSQLLKEVADDSNLPLLMHCAAGKDRTGFGAAMIHSVLGVDRETIYADFLMSNQFPLAEYADLPKTEAYKLFLGVDRSWLEGSFAAIEERYGSVDKYLEQGLGIDSFTQARIRKNLLQ